MTENEENVQEKIEYLNKEVSQLSDRLKSGEKPWFLEASTVVAVLALLFSFGTTFVTYLKSSQQEVLSYRIELRDLVKDIVAIPKEQVEIFLKYKNDPTSIAQLSAQLNSKNLSLSKQAAALIDRIENHRFGKGSVLDIDYMTVGTALLFSFQASDSKLLFEEAYLRARDATIASGALRSLAGVNMYFGNISSMRENFKKASEIYNKSQYNNDPDINKHVTNATTEIQWASAELQVNECSKSLIHLENSMPKLQLIPESPLKDQLNSQVSQLQLVINKNCTKDSTSNNQTH